MSNTFDKLSVLDSFIEEVNSYLPEIEANLERLAESPDDMDALEETYRRTHTIGGSASMMDCPGLSHVAHGMEDILGDAIDGGIVLDAATISLLQRSLSRLHQLLEGVRTGIDQDAVMAEDDADYVQYRTTMDSRTRGQISAAETTQTAPAEIHESYQTTEPVEFQTTQAFSTSQPPQLSLEPEVPVTSASSVAQPSSTPALPALPSLDEMLASFRTPNVAEGEDVAWPEEIEASAHQENQVETAHGSEPVPAPLSALELLASTAQRPAISPVSPVPAMPGTPMPQIPGALGEPSEPSATNEREHLPAFASQR
ncbi:MAG: Hpt domain-containing protein, partial [Chloroflexota bacterium]|nr:Hpt domain-containing protein [Chloroflexota bacterium]